MSRPGEQLEKRLKALSHTFPAALAGWHFTPALRRRVHERAASYAAGGWSAGRKTPDRSRSRLAVPAAVLAGLLVLLFAGARPVPPEDLKSPPVLQGEAVDTRLVDLDGRGSQGMVSVLRIHDAGDLNQFLALVWFLEVEAGSWELVYSEPLPKARVLPLEVVSRRQGGKLVLIPLRDLEGRALSPLVVGLESGKIFLLPYIP